MAWRNDQLLSAIRQPDMAWHCVQPQRSKPAPEVTAECCLRHGCLSTFMLKRTRFLGAAGLLAVSILAISSWRSFSVSCSWLSGRTTSLLGCRTQATACVGWCQQRLRDKLCHSSSQKPFFGRKPPGWCRMLAVGLQVAGKPAAIAGQESEHAFL